MSPPYFVAHIRSSRILRTLSADIKCHSFFSTPKLLLPSAGQFSPRRCLILLFIVVSGAILVFVIGAFLFPAKICMYDGRASSWFAWFSKRSWLWPGVALSWTPFCCFLAKKDPGARILNPINFLSHICIVG